MGNCQAAEAVAAAAVVQRPNGKSERLYGTVKAGELMTSHPGFHVALIISSGVSNGGSLRVTRIKLLRPCDHLLLGHVYRLVSSQEVMKGLWAKKCARMKLYGEFAVEEKNALRSDQSDSANDNLRRHEKQRGAWQPSLQSISESAS
ncbi:PREDICTED: uncharacterized protein LOC104798974 isoform X2 [Tarenaya hassleriana]|uniref:uncharacterized protein LOC104798974 isoform X2 n=1 Tax=Tarenaya hassleriana TaxID=28532 RepID=UPI00053C88A7|nr:PREDICTED: uncharacterized protein LOC104798974 isoform X2 [Tarenaya hassleriana]